MTTFNFLVVLALAVASVSGGRIARDSGYQLASGRAAQPAQPIAIVRSVYNAPSAESQNYDFSFETENGIQQEASGEMKLIDNAEVMVMRGSYTYIDAEGQDVTVSWVADENGYRAESAILPIAPEIPFPEQAEAVAAQIRFAQQEEQQAAASSNSYSSAPAPAGRYEAAADPDPFLAVLALTLASVSGGRIARDSSYQPAGGRAAQPAQPIAIVRSVYNAPSAESQNYDFSFETENGIQQEASGEMKLIDNAEVMVMRGSYTYIDAEGQDVTVSWVADENGYRAESAILPIAPEIPFPEQAEAVAAQIRFAQQEEQQAAASSNSYSSAPAPAGRYEAAAAPAQPNYGRRF
eukprot:maker-scaffold850_size89018-snap-gene-0.27 protein:Tk01246 transcript:maker-scaffold850_size89018-snap-gene-0.27-mRNA-1 annotation:"larval cuticle protein 8"